MPVSILKLQGVKIIISAFKTWILYTSGGSGNGVGGHGPCRPQSRRGRGANVVKYTHFEMLIIATRPCQLFSLHAPCPMPGASARSKGKGTGHGHGARTRAQGMGTGQRHETRARGKGICQGYGATARGKGMRQEHGGRAGRRARDKIIGQGHSARARGKCSWARAQDRSTGMRQGYRTSA